MICLVSIGLMSAAVPRWREAQGDKLLLIANATHHGESQSDDALIAVHRALHTIILGVFERIGSVSVVVTFALQSAYRSAYHGQ